MLPKDIIQNAQMALGQLQMTYRDSELPFHALAVAWEAARFAWYVADDDLGTAQDKLRLVKQAIAEFEMMLVKKMNADLERDNNQAAIREEIHATGNSTW